MLDGVDRRPPHNFHRPRATERSERLVRSINTGASHHCRIDRAGDSLLGNPRIWVSEDPARNSRTQPMVSPYRLGAAKGTLAVRAVSGAHGSATVRMAAISAHNSAYA